MSDRKGPSADCGCCAGVDSETPRRIVNPPAQPVVVYRTGTHARFKESMLARLSSSEYPALGLLGTRDDSDFTIALCDALATTLDVLTFYQERIANEHYLRTATEERSVTGMARLIGYAPAPGVAASTYLAFTLQEAPLDATRSAAPVTVPEGSRVQSVPGPEEDPQTFETVEAFEARAEWNEIAVQRTVHWRPVFGDTDLHLDGLDTRLQPGDAILIVGADRYADPGSERWDVRILESVEADTENERTHVAWADPIGHISPRVYPASEAVRVFALRQRAALFGHNAPDPRLMSRTGSRLRHLVQGSGASLRWKNYAIDPKRLDLDATYPKIAAGGWIALVSNEENRGSESLPGYVELYRVQRVFQVSRTDFGMSGKVTRIEPDTQENLTSSRYGIAETLVLGHSEELPAAERPLLYPLYGDDISLSIRVEELAPGQPLAVTGKRQRIEIAEGVNDLELSLDDGGSVSLSEGDSLILLEPPVRLVRSTPIYLEPETFGHRLGRADTRLRLQLLDRDGRAGTLLARASEIELTASLEDDPEVAEIALIAAGSNAIADDRDRTTVYLADALVHCYERATARVNANVARATHGETVEEILGGGDAATGDQSFAVRQSPLTYVSADTPSGRASTVELRVNDLLWTEIPTLYESAHDDRVYTVATDEAGAATVRFGDGVEGARLPTGQNNVRATYRKGIGVGGNVGAGALTNLLSRPLGVGGVSNPEAASGGEDRESLDRARDNAPLTVLTLDRAVSIKDYADFARAFAGIAKAHALWIPAGPARGVFLTVAGIDGAAVTEESDTYRNLLAALAAYGDPLVPVTLVDYRPASFRTSLAVKVATEYESDSVIEAVDDALRERFGFERRAFGQGVSIDEVVAAAHDVDGVEAVQVEQLYRPGPGLTTGVRPRLLAALPVASLTEIPKAAELLTLEENPIELEELS